MLLRRVHLIVLLITLIPALFLPINGSVSATESELFQDGWYRVNYIVDGDTIRVQELSRSIRLAGINAPEVNAAYGSEATATLRWLLAQSDSPGWVYLEMSSPSYDSGTDRYRAHVWFYNPQWGGWVLTQGYLVGTGLARVDRGYFASELYYAYLVDMETFAQSGKCGIWGGRRC